MNTPRLGQPLIQFVILSVILISNSAVVLADKPNIILIMADDHGRNDSSIYDKNSQAVTPNMHPEAWHTTHTDMQRRPDHGSFFTQWEVAAKTDAHAQAVINRFHRRPAVKFYDLANDPQETNNLANNPEYAADVEKMAKQLDDGIQENEDAVRMENKPYLLSEPYPGPQN